MMPLEEFRERVRTYPWATRFGRKFAEGFAAALDPHSALPFRGEETMEWLIAIDTAFFEAVREEAA